MKKMFGRIAAVAVAVALLCMTVLASGAAVIEPYDPGPDDYGWAEMDVEPSRIVWADEDFEYMYKHLPSYWYLSCGSTLSGLHGRYSIRMGDAYSVNVTDVKYSGNSLTFDYTAIVDLAPDAEGKTTYHGLLVLFYKAVSDSGEYCSKTSGKLQGTVDGYQIVKYVAPGTVGGQAEIESGEDISVDLPENFNPAKHVIGYAVWRIEDKDIVYKYENPDTQDFQYIADPSTDSSPVMLFDLSEYIPEPNTGFYGYDPLKLEYPITSRFLDTLNRGEGFAYWYRYGDYDLHKDYYGELVYLSRLWFDTYRIGDPEMWHKDYLERFDALLAESSTQYNESSNTPSYRVDSVSWDMNRLTVECSADFSVKYHYLELERNSGNVYEVYVPDYSTYPVLAIRDKLDDDLVCLGRVDSGVLSPEYRYGVYRDPVETNYPEEYYAPYTSSDKSTFTLEMPDFFDPTLYTLELYFSNGVEYVWIDEPQFFNMNQISVIGYGKPDPTPDPDPEPTPDPDPEPTPEPGPLMGDANGDGVVNLADASHTLKHIAGWDVEIDLAAANMNGDTGVNLVDVSRIMKLVAGWVNI